MVVLERERELDVLLTALERANDGHGAAVLVSGEAGIGKTTLLRAFTDGIADRGIVWSGGCDDLVTPRPLGPFREMFAGHDVPIERDAMIDEVVRRLAREPRAVAVVIDDAQWADDASLDVVRYLARRVGDLPLVLCLAYRDDELGDDHPLRRLVGALIGASVVRLALGPLGRASIATLVADSRVDADELLRVTGGNPFLVTESLRSPDDNVPRPVRDAILARLEILDPAARSVVELASQMPGGVDFTTVSGLVGSAVGALRDAEAAGLLAFSRDSFRFRHELVRRAVDVSLTDGHRLALNRRLLSYHEATGRDRHALVHHAALAHDWSALTRHAPAVVEEVAAAGAHYVTVRLASLALDHRELLEQRTTATLLLHAANAQYMLNRFGEAADLADQAVAVLESSTDEVALGDALLVASRMHTVTGRPTLARRDAVRAVDLLAPVGAGRSRAMAFSTMANLECLAGNDAEAFRWGLRARDAAEEVGARDVAAHARTYLGVARIGIGDASGVDDLRAAIEEATRIGHAEYLFRSASNLAVVLLWSGRAPEAREPLALAFETARDHDIRYGMFHTTAQRCHVDLLLGDWARAESDLGELLASDEDDPAAMLVLPLSLLGRLRARQGDPGAGDLVRRAWRIAVESNQAFRIANAGLARVELAWHTSSDDHLAVVCQELLGRVNSASTPYFEGEVRRYLRRAGVDGGSFEGCPPALDAGIRGDWAAAARRWSRVGAAYHEALELVESTERETALRGLGVLDELGATGSAAKIRQQLRGRGWSSLPRGPRRETREHPAGLTPRQVDVLAELVEGKTSAEIGETLFVSSRTVDNHVAAIVRKLGAADRRDAIRIALEQDLAARTDHA